MLRRQFIGTSAKASASAILFSSGIFKSGPLLEKIGIQFFSLPKMLDEDLTGALSMLSKMGYTEVELYGPYPFSSPSAIERWNAVTPSLGFKGSGYFGHTAKEMKKLLEENGFSVPSIHTDLNTLQTRMNKLGEAAQILGNTYVVLPSIPPENRKTLDDYKKMAEAFNIIGESAKKEGIKFAYHNHGYGLKEVNGQIPLELIFANTDPSLVFFEMDLYWTTAGGGDPIILLEKYKGRYPLMHVKDMMKIVHFSGDGGDPKQWIELFPYMTTAGNGVLDLKSIITKAKENGTKHFIVEQDMVKEPEIALKKSYDYLASL
ncbi:MAG TPA: sugar phosphate isomerase/epimerase [Puia sp.]|jgi:sugar phosphate isomerase/epimerase|nr:sugar phosphate isomerase/epimerase [Puia sp.]